MDSTNNRIGSIRFDDETVLEVSQKGGGGAGVGGTGGLEARNLITGESTNEKIEDLTEDLEDAQETIETQAGQIEDLTEDLQEANDRITALEAELSAATQVANVAFRIVNNNTTKKVYYNSTTENNGNQVGVVDPEHTTNFTCACILMGENHNIGRLGYTGVGTTPTYTLPTGVTFRTIDSGGIAFNIDTSIYNLDDRIIITFS